jgi:DNA-binding sugar fermentation-stimulating protein
VHSWGAIELRGGGAAQGLILAKPSRFIFDVRLGAEEHKCYCPATSSPGGLSGLHAMSHC